MANTAQPPIASPIPFLSDEQQAQVAEAYVRESIARAALIQTNLEIAKRTFATLGASPAIPPTVYKDAIEKFKNWRQEPNSVDTFHKYLDLESLNLYFYRQELESLCDQWNDCTGNDSVEKIESLVQTLRVTLKDSDKFLPHIRGKNHQDDLVRAGLRKIKRSGHAKSADDLYRMKPESIWTDMFSRYLIANIGGTTLLLPMIIMSFAKSRAAHLIVTSLFVLGFAFLIAAGTRASNQELLGATAAYAAVLVVYVGTASPN